MEKRENQNQKQKKKITVSPDELDGFIQKSVAAALEKQLAKFFPQGKAGNSADPGTSKGGPSKKPSGKNKAPRRRISPPRRANPPEEVPAPRKDSQGASSSAPFRGKGKERASAHSRLGVNPAAPPPVPEDPTPSGSSTVDSPRETYRRQGYRKPTADGASSSRHPPPGTRAGAVTKVTARVSVKPRRKALMERVEDLTPAWDSVSASFDAFGWMQYDIMEEFHQEGTRIDILEALEENIKAQEPRLFH